MTTGRTPTSGARLRPSGPGGSSLQVNLPYLIVVAVCLVVLVGFIATADPFATDGTGSAAAGTTPTTGAAAATSTTGAVAAATTTTLAGETTTTSGSALTGAARGEEIFNATCIACHGVGGVGVEGLGKPLTTSTFASGLTDDELLAFLIVGRLDTDPLNTTGIAMPARGGNTSLSDDDLRAVVAYLRTLAA